MTTETGLDEAAAKRRTALLTVAIPALVGFLGGVVSGGVTAYVQLKTKSEEYSIKRAELFRELMEELGDEREKTARLAVLNLWQLYPEERDRRVITAAAFAVNQPDLVGLVAGIDEQADPVVDMLHVRALSDNPEIHTPALQTLINVQPTRAAGVLIEKVKVVLDGQGGKLPSVRSGFNPVRELERLAAQDETVAEMIKDETDGTWGFFFDYMLYRAGRESGFIARIEDGYDTGKDLNLVNDYVHRGQFFDDDLEVVIAATGDYIVETLKSEDRNDFQLVRSLSALRNGSFTFVLTDVLGDEFVQALRTTVQSKDNYHTLRIRAFELLDVIQPSRSMVWLIQSLVAEDHSSKLMRLADKHVTAFKMEQFVQLRPGLEPPDCAGVDYSKCIREDPELWQSWIKTNGLE